LAVGGGLENIELKGKKKPTRHLIKAKTGQRGKGNLIRNSMGKRRVSVVTGDEIRGQRGLRTRKQSEKIWDRKVSRAEKKWGVAWGRGKNVTSLKKGGKDTDLKRCKSEEEKTEAFHRGGGKAG